MNELFNDPVSDVMNNTDLFREVFSYLRKNPEIGCSNCNLVIQWDKTKPKKYDYVSNGKFITCFTCWQKGHDCWVC